MPGDQTFGQQLQPHVGGLVRVRYDGGGGASSLNGKIGLLMSADGRHDACTSNSAVVEVLIEERVRFLLLYSHEIELIGADDAM